MPVSSSGSISTSPTVTLCIAPPLGPILRTREATVFVAGLGLLGGAPAGDFGHCFTEPVNAFFDILHGDIAEGEPDVVRGHAIGEELRALADNHRALVRSHLHISRTETRAKLKPEEEAAFGTAVGAVVVAVIRKRSLDPLEFAGVDVAEVVDVPVEVAVADGFSDDTAEEHAAAHVEADGRHAADEARRPHRPAHAQAGGENLRKARNLDPVVAVAQGE